MTSLYVLHLIFAGLLGIHSKIITVSKVSVEAGGSISIPCLYEAHYKKHVKYLCKGGYWSFCKYAVKTNQPDDDSRRFLISDDPNQSIFTVTIKDLTAWDTYYWCAVEKDEEPDVKEYFYLSVTGGTPSLYVDQQEITAYEGGSVTVRCRYRNRKVRKWCRLTHMQPIKCVPSPSGSIDGTTVTIDASAPYVFTVTMSELRTESSGWYWCDTENFQMPVRITVHALTSTTTTTTTVTPSTANIITTRPTTTQHSSLLTSAEPHSVQPTNSTINGTAGESQQDENKSSTMVTILTTTLILLLLIALAAFFGWKMMKRCNKTQPQRSDITAGSHIGSDPDVQYATIVHNQHVAAQQKNDTPEDSVTYSDIVLKDSVRQMAEPVDGSVIYSTIHSKTD